MGTLRDTAAVNSSKSGFSHGSMCLSLGPWTGVLGSGSQNSPGDVVGGANQPIIAAPAPHQALCVAFTAGFLRTDLS